MSAAEPPPYQVRLRSRRVQKDMDGCTEADHRRLTARLKTLAQNPRPPGCEKLAGEVYRIRVGDLRVIYLVDDAARRVEVGAVRRRSERTYRRVEELFG